MGERKVLPLGSFPRGTQIEAHHYPIEVIYTDQNKITRLSNPKELRQDTGFIVVAVSTKPSY